MMLIKQTKPLLFILLIIFSNNQLLAQDTTNQKSVNQSTLNQYIIKKDYVVEKGKLSPIQSDDVLKNDTAIDRRKFVAEGTQYKILPEAEMLKMLKDSFASNVASLSGSTLNGNSNSQLPLVIYPSPDNMSLTREVQDNVDLYTGKLNINIPLHILKSRDIEVPVSVSYNAGGIKVNDIASSVGLGWSLNAGGAITRVMHNLPDEFQGTVNPNRLFPNISMPAVGYIHLKNGPENLNFSNFNNYSLERKRQIIDYSNWSQLDGFCIDYGGDCPRAYDSQPDEFFFNTGKISGKFFFDQDGEINLVSNQNLKINKTIQVVNGKDKITNFEIIADDGYIYKFGGFDKNAIEESQLITVNSDTRYRYDLAAVAVSTNPFTYIYFRKPFINRVYVNGINYPDDFFLPNKMVEQKYFFFPSTWYLTEIVSPTNNKVNLNYSSNGNIEYLTSRSFGASLPSFTEIQDGNGNWFFKTFSRYVNEPPNTTDHYKNNQTFSINISKVLVSTKKIQSIVGEDGNMVSFENNIPRQDLINDKQLDFIKIKNNGTAIKSYQFEYETKVTTEGAEEFNMGLDNGFPTAPVSFGVNPSNNARLFLKKITESSASGGSMPPILFDYDPNLLPRRLSVHQDAFGFANYNSNRHPFYLINYYDGTNTGMPASQIPLLPWSVLGLPPAHGGNRSMDPVLIKSGILTKVTYPTGGTKEFEYEPGGSTTISWDGVKIKSIKQKETPLATPVITNYTFSDYHATDGIIHRYFVPDYKYEARFNYTTDRFNPSLLTKGTTGGYKNVEVSQPNNGKSLTTFLTSFDYPNQAEQSFNMVVPSFPQEAVITNPLFTYPFPSANTYDWQRGLIKSQKTYNQNNNLLNEAIYNYDFNPINLPTKSIPNLVSGKFEYTGSSYTEKFFCRNISNHISKWYTLLSKTERVYEQNGTNYSESIENYDYKKYTFNNKDYLFPYLTKNLKNSKNEQTVSITKYPLDYNTFNGDSYLQGIAHLKSKNVLSAPIEQYTYKQDQNGNNKKYVGASLNTYHINKPLLKSIFKLQTNGLINNFTEAYINSQQFYFDNRYRQELHFPKYDANGRVQEQNKEWDIKEAYIWNYNKMYPVAKAVNADNAEIAFSSFEADEADSKAIIVPANVIDNAAQAFTGKKYYSLNNPLSINITTSLNKIYKLSFWAKDGSLIVYNVVGGVPNYVTTPNVIKTKTGWSYYEVTMPSNFTGQAQIQKGVSSNVYLDEVRLHPTTSQMNTYTFTPLIGMTSETDVNGKTMYYEYDNLNRLSTVRNEDKDIVKTVCYNYASQPVPCAVGVCPSPVINSLTRSGFSATINYTAPANSTYCSIKVENLTTGVIETIFNVTGCTSPNTFTIQSKFSSYAITVTSYSTGCPNGTSVTQNM